MTSEELGDLALAAAALDRVMKSIRKRMSRPDDRKSRMFWNLLRNANSMTMRAFKQARNDA